MNLEQFLSEFQQAVIRTRACCFEEVPTAYPTGDRVRVKIYRRGGDGSPVALLPTSLDPIQTVWYARTGAIVSAIDCVDLGRRLGLSDADISHVCEAADHAIEDLSEEARLWRLGLLYVLDGLLLSPPVRH